MTQVAQSGRRRSPLLLVILVVVVVAVIAAVYFLTRSGGGGMPKPETRADQQQAADDALVILRDLARDNYQVLGFSSADEAQNATLGTPLNVLFVPLDRLKEYSPNQDPNELLADSALVLYPVELDREARSSVQVQGSTEGWTPAGFGSATLIRAAAAIQPSEDAFLVQVPSLGLYFVGQRDGENLVLISLFDDARFDITAGSRLEARQLFERILPAALELDTEAPM